MFFRVVGENAAFQWLRSDGGDAALLLASPPLTWEGKILWLVRAEAGELLRVTRTYHRLWSRRQVMGICWHAGAALTAELGTVASFCCGSKFLLLGSGRAATAEAKKRRRPE